MAAELDQLARYWRERGDPHRADFYRTLAEQERAIGGPETVLPLGTPAERKLAPILREKFTNVERELLIDDGARVYSLTGATILDQEEAQRQKGRPSFSAVVGGESLLTRPSMRIEIAIFPQADRLFVPDSFYKSLQVQKDLTAKDAQVLRNRLGLQGITQIIPNEPSTLTGVVFQHLDATEEWLFGQEYASAQGLAWVYGRTSNPTDGNGFYFSYVGHATDQGLQVNGFDRGDENMFVGVMRVVVPIEIN